MKTINLILLFVILISTEVHSQEKKDLVKEGTVVNLENTIRNDEVQRSQGSHKLDILNEKIMTARISGDVNQVDRLNKELHRLNGVTPDNGQSVPVYNISYQGNNDNLLNSTSISQVSDVTMIYNEFATVTEQIGPTKGRIWALYKWKETGAFADPMHITLKYSDNGGTLWVHYITFSFTSHYFNPGNYLDVECRCLCF